MVSMLPLREAWLAGLLDGEGSIGIRLEHKPRRVHRPVYLAACVQMSITEKSAVDAALGVLEEMGVRGARYSYEERDPTKHRDAWYLRVPRLVDIHLLSNKMIPHAVVKRKQWELILEYTASRLEKSRGVDDLGRVHRGGLLPCAYTVREVEIARQLHELNLRGPAAIKRDEQWQKKLMLATNA